MAKKYTSSGHKLTKTNAKILGKFIEKTFPKGVEAGQLVHAAKAKSSPIHHLFEWDNKKAADRYRLHQARWFLLELRIDLGDGETQKEFHNVFIKKSRMYVNTEQALSDVEIWSQVIDDALKRLIYWRDQYKEYKEFRVVVKEINNLERKLNAKEKRKTKRKRRG